MKRVSKRRCRKPGCQKESRANLGRARAGRSKKKGKEAEYTTIRKKSEMHFEDFVGLSKAPKTLRKKRQVTTCSEKHQCVAIHQNRYKRKLTSTQDEQLDHDIIKNWTE